MDSTQNLYEPVVNFRETRPQMQIETSEHHEFSRQKKHPTRNMP